eukprot:TRINITY_DN2199_c0_g1_i6.p1 TRINITY_DN2199_c0_g1~~TRINITY_DN2199_c0_g1_i6.p1  ORF type:complete len:1061 (-),score=210.50 TRINITY_DN2199_c0_g1_i6:188-3025(-)
MCVDLHTTAKKTGIKKLNTKTWSEDTEKCGYLLLKKRKQNQWNKYWFVLQGNRLFYYTRPHKPNHKGVIDLTAVTSVDAQEEGRFALQMQSSLLSKPVFLRAEDVRLRDEWITELKPRLGPSSTYDTSQKPIGYRLSCCAQGLERKEAAGLMKSEPFLAIYPFTGDHYKGFRGYNKLIWRSEVIANESNPHWEPFPLFFAHTEGMDTNLVVECWDYRRNGNPKLIGQFTASLKELLDTTTRQWFFINPKKKTPFYKHSGKFFVINSEPIPATVKDPFDAFTYQISFMANDLEFKDINLQSNPFIVVKGRANTVTGLQKATGETNMCIIAKTETVWKHTSKVQWEPVNLDIRLTNGLFEEMIIEVYDWNKSMKHEFIGSVRTTLHTLLMSSPRFPIINEKKKGTVGYKYSGELFVSSYKANYQPPEHDPQRFCFEVAARDIDRKDMTGTSDPYFVILSRPYPTISKPYHWNLDQDLKMNPPESSKVPIFKSEVIKKNLKPVWKPFELNVSEFGGYDNPLIIQIWDHERSGIHNYVGEFETTLRELILPNNKFRVAHPKKSYSMIFPNSGIFEVQKVTAIPPLDDITPPTGFDMLLKAEKIERKDMMGLAKSDPFFTIAARPYMQSQPIRIFKSDTVLNSRSPEWRPFKLTIGECGGWDSTIKFEFWDQSPKGKSSFIGEFTTTIRELTFYKSNSVWAIVNPKKTGRIGYMNSGLMFVIKADPIIPEKKETPIPQNYTAIQITTSAAHQTPNLIITTTPIMDPSPTPTLQHSASVAVSPSAVPGTIQTSHSVQVLRPAVSVGTPTRVMSVQTMVPTGQPIGTVVRSGPPVTVVSTGQPLGTVVPTGQPMQPPMGQPIPSGQPVQVPMGQPMQTNMGPPMGQPVQPPMGQPIPSGQPVQVPMGQPVQTNMGPPMGQPMPQQNLKWANPCNNQWDNLRCLKWDNPCHNQ